MTLDSYLKKQTEKINRALEGCLPPARERPAKLHEAMREAVLSGGKRVRPILTLAACEAAGGKEEAALPAACAIELIHNYSLVHDDLPAMDDDDTRRGRAACHVKFGEETAILAGDALLTLAFNVLCRGDSSSRPNAGRILRTIHLISEAIGTRGMVGGQAVDLEFQKKEMDLPTAEYINTRKSGALIAVSARVGALVAGAAKKEEEALYRYGKFLGLLFQIVDDILDCQGYAKVIGVSESKKEALLLSQRAKKEIKIFGKKGTTLNQLADFVLNRKA
ncbi:MAG: polyprenyl synthetase family protein [Candidatus Omnitrophica bacterium]|nr:polyprenyl synthetase family protein [Candidatus Omnitrophota bacterium]